LGGAPFLRFQGMAAKIPPGIECMLLFHWVEMTTIVPVKGVSGKIYRFSMLTKVTELPEVGGIYCFAFPLRYPGSATGVGLSWSRSS
jgi:hypothetical protein